MEDRKLKVIVNLKNGKYVFHDNKLENSSILMRDEDISLLSKMKSLREEIVKEYDFSPEMISIVDPILYEKLKEYDEQNGTKFMLGYLNVIAKEIDRIPDESSKVYLERCARIRKKALQNAGIEIVYVMAKKSEIENLSLIEKLELIRVANRQQTLLGATITDAEEMEEMQDKDLEAVADVKEEPVQATEQHADSDSVESAVDPEAIMEPKMEIPSFLQEILDRRDGVDTVKNQEDKAVDVVEPEEIMSEDKLEVSGAEDRSKKSKAEPKTERKTLSRRQSIQASKKAMRESRKMKNVYKQKMEQASKPKATTQSQKPKAKKRKQDIKYNPIVDGKMLGIDETRPSAIVKTFVIPSRDKEQDKIVSDQGAIKPEVLVTTMPEKEGRICRYTRKIKDKADSIKNRIAMSKDRFKTIAAVVAVAAVVSVVGIITIPRAIATIPLGNEYNSEVTIQVYDGVERVAVDEVKVGSVGPEVEKAEEIIEADSKVESYIRDMGVGTTGKVSEETNSSSMTAEDIISEIEEEQEASEELKEIESDSATYLKSIKIGSRMKIDSGKYFECPDGSGNYGRFENHAGEAKILSRIGIATNEGYFSISSEDISLFELKQKYPDAKFSYHFVDENGHVLGWLTSESFENVIEQQVEDEMDR